MWSVKFIKFLFVNFLTLPINVKKYFQSYEIIFCFTFNNIFYVWNKIIRIFSLCNGVTKQFVSEQLICNMCLLYSDDNLFWDQRSWTFHWPPSSPPPIRKGGGELPPLFLIDSQKLLPICLFWTKNLLQ